MAKDRLRHGWHLVHFMHGKKIVASIPESLYPTPLKINAIIADSQGAKDELLRLSGKENPSWVTPIIAETTENTFLDHFLHSPIAENVYKEAQQELQTTTPEDRQSKLRRLKGYVFSTIASGYLSYLLSSQGIENRLILDDTLDFYHRFIYPHGEIDQKPYNQSTIKGVSIPDGILLTPERKSIQAFVEFTYHKSRDFSPLVNGLVTVWKEDIRGRHHRTRRNPRYSSFFAEKPYILAVMVRNIGLHRQDKERIRDNILHVIRLPFTYNQFNSFFEVFLHHDFLPGTDSRPLAERIQ